MLYAIVVTRVRQTRTVRRKAGERKIMYVKSMVFCHYGIKKYITQCPNERKDDCRAVNEPALKTGIKNEKKENDIHNAAQELYGTPSQFTTVLHR